MKNYFLLLALLILISSCDQYEYKPIDYEKAGTLYLQDELLEYLDYYKANETLRFKKATSKSESSDKLRDPEEGNQSAADYWNFSLEGLERNFESGQEEQKMIYLDHLGNQLTLIIRSKAYVPRATGLWERVQDQFTLKYSAPCTGTYIDYITKAYRTNTWSIKKESIMLPSKEVGGTTYKDVIQLKTIKEGSHFAFYVTKLDGIIQIDNLDLDINWIKVD